MRNLIRIIARRRRCQKLLHRGIVERHGFAHRTVDQSARKRPRVNAQVHNPRRRIPETDGQVAVTALDDLRRTAAEGERGRLGRAGWKELERLREQLFETDESWIEDLTRGLYTVDPPRSEKPAVKEKPEDTSDAAAGQEEEGPLSDEEVLVQLLDEVPEKKEAKPGEILYYNVIRAAENKAKGCWIPTFAGFHAPDRFGELYLMPVK